MRLLVLTAEKKRPSYRLRVEAVLSRVEGVQFETVELPRSGGEMLREIDRAGEFDAVLLHKRLLETGPVRRLRQRAKRLYYDVDDAVMVTSPPPSKGDSLWGKWKRRRRFAATAEAVDVAVTGNQYLARFFEPVGTKTVVVPTCVEPGEYRVADGSGAGLVWIGSRSTLPYLEEMLPAITAAGRGSAGVKLTVIADRAPASVPGVEVQFVPWTLAGEKADLLRGAVGIAPTPEDRESAAWTRGKCGFKIIQYMAAGLPVIASPVEANREIVSNGETGIWATTREEWTAAVVRLLGDAELRKNMGQAGRRKAEQQYSLAHAADVWRGILRGE